jgi:lauroyl/myristoyl acyltransferase
MVGVTAGLAGMVLGRAMRSRRVMIGRHLQRIHGPGLVGAALDREVDRAFDSYARYWMESFRLPGITCAELEQGMSYEGLSHLEVAKAQGRGVIMAMPHLGGWDFGGAWLAAIGFPLTVVVEPIEPPELFEWFADFRRSMGLTVVPLGPQATSGVLGTLREGGVVGLLSDRDLTGHGIEVTFFGERTTLPAGPATLALRTGAPLLPCAVFFEGRGHRGVVGAPLDTARQGSLRQDIGRVTQLLADQLAVLIARAPEQWHVFQPNWPSDPGYHR